MFQLGSGRSAGTMLLMFAIAVSLAGIWFWGLTDSPQAAFAEVPAAVKKIVEDREAVNESDAFDQLASRSFQTQLIPVSTKPAAKKLPEPPKITVKDTFVSQTFQQATIVYQGKTLIILTGDQLPGGRAKVESIDGKRVILKMPDGRTFPFYENDSKKEPLP